MLALFKVYYYFVYVCTLPTFTTTDWSALKNINQIIVVRWKKVLLIQEYVGFIHNNSDVNFNSYYWLLNETLQLKLDEYKRICFNETKYFLIISYRIVTYHTCVT